MAAAPTEDRDVVKAVLAGRSDQFALLVQRYHRPLLHVAQFRLGRADVADDAVQDAFVCAFRSLHTYKPEFSFRTWLWTILLNQCRRHGARLTRLPIQRSETSDGILNPIDEPAPDLSAMLNERNELVRALLHQLPEPQADAIRLRFFAQLKYREIADTMQSSLSSAKQRVRHGLLAMGEMLRERELIDSVFPGDKS